MSSFVTLADTEITANGSDGILCKGQLTRVGNVSIHDNYTKHVTNCKRALRFLLGKQKRVGIESPVQLLLDDLLFAICESVMSTQNSPETFCSEATRL